MRKNQKRQVGTEFRFLRFRSASNLSLVFFYACFLAPVVMIKAHSVSHMYPEMPGPQLRVILEVIL